LRLIRTGSGYWTRFWATGTQHKMVIEEVAAARETERGTRADDKRTEAAMEDRKKEGYF